MSKIITLRKGLDINLVGKPQETLATAPMASEYALSPLDFEGVTPKLLVKAGDRVKAGTALFFNKFNERILFTSPVSGTVSAINRGEKRKVLSFGTVADAHPAPLRHHRQPRSDAEGHLHLGVRFGAPGPGLQLRAQG